MTGIKSMSKIKSKTPRVRVVHLGDLSVGMRRAISTAKVEGGHSETAVRSITNQPGPAIRTPMSESPL